MSEVISKIQWVEKYRPQTLGDVIGHESNIQRLKAMVAKQNIPNMLFAGPAGTGKTATAWSLGHDLYGEYANSNFVELNASDERGIETVRGKIKTYAQAATLGDVGFVTIFLDEADSLTDAAQAALRRTMEVYSDNCRFILSCNYQSKLIEPIQSRCLPMKFGKLSNDELLQLIGRICQAESLSITKSAAEAIIKYRRGDTRKIINELQSASFMTDKITVDIVSRTAMIPDDITITKMMDLSLEGNFETARDILMNEFINKGFDAEAILDGIFYNMDYLNDRLSGFAKSKLIDKLSQADVNIKAGAHPHIHLASVINSIGALAAIQTHCPNVIASQTALIQ